MTLVTFSGQVALKLRDDYGILLSRIAEPFADRLIRKDYLNGGDAATTAYMLASIHQRMATKLALVGAKA